jgi:hypothetical protein
VSEPSESIARLLVVGRLDGLRGAQAARLIRPNARATGARRGALQKPRERRCQAGAAVKSQATRAALIPVRGGRLASTQ